MSSEVAELTERLRSESLANGSGQDFEQLILNLNALTQGIRNSGLTERSLNLLIDTTHDLSGTLSLQDLLRKIVTRARSLVGANIAWLTLLDAESGMFRTVTAEGHLLPTTAEMTARMEYGAVSLVMRSKSFFDTQDYLRDERFEHSPELDRLFQAESIVSLAGFPILSEDNVQGFLFVADRYSRKLSGREISVLGSFALYAGVAMRNARAFKMLSEALAEAERNRVALTDHIQRVEASAATHDEMTSLLAKGAELQQFLQRMANQIDGAILLCDTDFAVKEEFSSPAYQGHLAADLRKGMIDQAALISATSESRRTGRSVVMIDRGEEHCRAMMLHGGTGRGESLVICYSGELDAIGIRNLERSTVALSIAKLWNEKRETEKVIASSTLLRHLILVNPPDHATISAIRNRLNLHTDQPVMLGLLAISGLDRASQTNAIREAAARVNLLVDLVNDTYLAIGPEKSIRDFLQNLSNRRKGWDIGGILSDPFSDLEQSSACYARLDQALRLMSRMKRLNRVLEQSQVNLFAKLFEASDATRITRYVEETLAAINDRDPRQKTQLKHTLLSFFDSQYNIARTADLLGVHINTIRQRLDILRETTGGWEDPLIALELHVALRLDAITSTS